MSGRQLEVGVFIGQGVELLRAPDVEVGSRLKPEFLFQLSKELGFGSLIHDLDLEGTHIALPIPCASDHILIRMSELLLFEPLDIHLSGVGVVKGRHDRDDAGVHHVEEDALVVSLELYGVLVVEEVDLGHRGADSDVFELEVLSGAVRRHRFDGYHIVLVAVHKEPLQVPGIAGCHVVVTSSVIYGRMGGSQGPSNSEHSRLIPDVHPFEVDKPGTIGNTIGSATQVVSAGGDDMHRRDPVDHGHLPLF